jgi:hypothetical protein
VRPLKRGIFLLLAVLLLTPRGVFCQRISVNGSGSAGSGLVFLEEHVASNSSVLDFTGLTSAYDLYVFEVWGLVPATNSDDLQVRMSTNGGVSYDLWQLPEFHR